MGLTKTTSVVRVNRATAGLLSQLGSPLYPWGDTCKGCKRNIRHEEDALYHIGLFFYEPFCMRCAERHGYVDFATVRTWAPVEEPEPTAPKYSQPELEAQRAHRNDAIRVLVQMGLPKGDATKAVWTEFVGDPTLTADELVAAAIRTGRTP